MVVPPVRCLPDGSSVLSWTDHTTYTLTYHVAQGHPRADDNNPGTLTRPWRTLARAKEVGPGQELLVFSGIYRETLAPAQGGQGPGAMVRFRAAPGERVVLSGAHPILTESLTAVGPRLWRVDLRHYAAMMDPLLNPYASTLIGRPPWYRWHHRPVNEILRALGRRGMIWDRDGIPLRQGDTNITIRDNPGSFVVSDSGEFLLIHSLHDNLAGYELALRPSGFRPSVANLGWISVSGFLVERTAGQVAPPLRGAIDSRYGHHWLIHNNVVQDVVGTGISVGGDADRASFHASRDVNGGFQIYDNVVQRAGISAIAATNFIDHSRIQGNRISHIGWLDLEHLYESAAIKIHLARHCLIADNHISDLRFACGIWLDFLCENCLVNGNWIERVSTLLAAIYLEANYKPVWATGNLIDGISDVPDNDPPKDGFPGGNGIVCDMSEQARIADNVIFNCSNAGIAAVLLQGERLVGNRVPAGTDHQLTRNLVVAAGHHIIVDSPARHAFMDNHSWDSGPVWCRSDEKAPVPVNNLVVTRQSHPDGLTWTTPNGPGQWRLRRS